SGVGGGRDRIVGGAQDARLAKVVIGPGQTELFSRPHGNDRIIGTIKPKDAADGLQFETVTGMNVNDILSGHLLLGSAKAGRKPAVLSGGANDDQSQLKITKGANNKLDTVKDPRDVLDKDGNIIAGADKQLHSIANYDPATDDVIVGTILEGADNKL